MKKLLFAPIVATISIALFACSGEGATSSNGSETSETESSSSHNGSSNSSKGSSSSTKEVSSNSQNKSSSSEKSTSSSSSSTKSSSSVTSSTSSSSEFSYTIENDEMLLDLKQMKVTDKRDGHVYDVELLADGTLHMIQPINFEVPEKSWCFNNYEPNCEKYGRLYKWGNNSSINRSCSTNLPRICPEGWGWFKQGTNAYYAGYRSIDGEFMGFGEVQMYWGLTNPSTMESNHHCDETVYVSEYCRDSSTHCAVSWYDNGQATLHREKAVYINCAYGKINVPDTVTLPKSTYQFPEYDTTKIAQEYSGDYGELIDLRDGNIYKTIKIGEQTWMAENLKFAIDSSWCHSRDCEANEYLGRYYAWYGAHNLSYRDTVEWPIQGVCPDGWHIPTLEEWEKLFHYVLDITGGHSLAKTLMTTESWGNKEHGGYNTFGFTVKPSGEAYCLNWRVIDEAKHFSAVQYGTYYMISGEGNSRMYVKFGNAEENVEPMFDRTTGDTYVYPNIRCILGEGSKGIHPQADDSEKN